METVRQVKKYELDFRDYGYILLKRKHIIIFSMVLTALFSFIFASSKTPVYQASASIKIESSEELKNLMMSAYSYTPYMALMSELEVIKSYPVMELVAKDMGYLDPELSSSEIKSSEQYLEVLKSIQEQISTELDETSNIITITVTSSDNEIAKKLANTTARIYQKYRRQESVKRTTEAKEFIKRQLEKAEKIITDSENKLNELKEQNNLFAVEDEIRFTSQRLMNLEVDLKDTIEKKSDIQFLISQISKSGPEDSFARPYTEGGSSTLATLNSRLLELVLERKRLPIDYTPEHPQVKIIDKQIKDIKDEMVKELANQLNALLHKEKTLSEEIKLLTSKGGEMTALERQALSYERDIKQNEALVSFFKSKYQEVQLKETEQVEEATIVKMAMLSNSPLGDKTKTTVFLGLVIGLVFGVIIAIVRESLDTSLGTIEDVESFLGVPVLGLIPHMEESSVFVEDDENAPGLSKRMRHMISHFDPKSTVAESYRTLRTNMQFSSVKEKRKTFIMASSYMGEGKTTTLSNIAITFAQDGNRVLVLDCDLRKSVLHRHFGLEMENGVTDVLLGKVSWKDAVKDIADFMVGDMPIDDVTKTPGLENLYILTAGGIPPNPSELLNSRTFSKLLDEVKREFDVILIDSPPILAVADTTIISPLCDALIMVHRSGKIPRKVLQRAKILIDNVHGNVSGIVLNDLSAKIFPEYSKYQIKYYGRKKKGVADEELGRIELFKEWLYNSIPILNNFQRRLKSPATRVVALVISILLIALGFILQSRL